MLKFKLLCAAALVAAVGFSAASADLSAGIFDKLKWRRNPAKSTSTKFAKKAPAVRRGQSPHYDPADYARSAYVTPAGAQAPAYGVDTAWYNSGYSSAGDNCCGPEDTFAWQTEHFRQKCDQTFYCPVPPYCYACFGHYPTCWTRLEECQICPRVEFSRHPVLRRTAPAGTQAPPESLPPADPAAPPAAVPPPDLPDDARLRGPARATPTRIGLQEPADPAPWSDYADSIIEEVETEGYTDGTLEEQIAEEEFEQELVNEGDEELVNEGDLEDAQIPPDFEEFETVEEPEIEPGE